MSKHRTRFSFRFRWFLGARKLWNSLAFHLVVDDAHDIFTLTLAIPLLFTWIVQCPLIPYWCGRYALTGGVGERAEYGIWHDYYETKLQWRRIINLSGPRSGLEKRWTHYHGNVRRITRHETIITGWIADLAQSWVDVHRVDRWKLVIATRYAASTRWWIPSLYDHYFVLHAQKADGIDHVASIKAHVSKRLFADEVFTELTNRLSFE